MSKLDSDNKAVTSIELKLRLKKTRISLPSVFPVRLLAGIHCLELKDKSWIPEQVRDDSNKAVASIELRVKVTVSHETYCLSGMLVGRNPLFRT